jgi:hypothetical protein
VRSSQSKANSSQERPKEQNDRTPGRVFHLTREEVKVASDVVAGTQLMNNINVLVFELGATHLFITRRIVTKIGRGGESNRKKGFIIRTPIGNRVETDSIYVGVGVSLPGYETKVNLMPLELHDFNTILGMIS